MKLSYTKIKTSVLIFWLLGLTLGTESFAYHLDDHRAITQQAFKEIATCFPKSSALLDIQWLVTGDLDEDTDLVTKWFFYSHYFNPYKHLAMARGDSAARVRNLSAYLTPGTSNSLDVSEIEDLGHLIHHFQDMTVPAHVVPVSHGFFDGFESFQFAGDIASGMSCDQIAALAESDLQTILRETAIQTLASVRENSVDVVAVTNGIENHLNLGLSAFWMESPNDRFGDYGILGNNFGKSNFVLDGVEYRVSPQFAPDFKQRQLRLAVVATLRGLMWQLSPLLMAENPTCLSGVL